MEKDLWLSTDEAREAVLSLEMVLQTLPKVIENIHYWKWVLIVLHNALQGYMVLALRGTNGLNVLTKKCAEKWRAAWQKDEDCDERRLDNFLNLYEKIQSGLMLMYWTSQPFKPQGTQTKSVKMLNDLRNEFIHFLHANWLRGIHGLPRVVEDCIDIIDFLVCECGNIIWYDQSLKQRSKDLISQVRKDLEPLKGWYGE